MVASRLCARLMLPLSRRQGVDGGVADGKWWPVHSRGLFEVSPLTRHRRGATGRTLYFEEGELLIPPDFFDHC